MVSLSVLLSLAGYAAGALGGVLVFVELFQTPNYVEYDPDFNSYNVDIAPTEVYQYTWMGRAGAILIAFAFALEFLATLLAL